MPILTFLRDNGRWIGGGFLLTMLSTFGQTIFISLSAGEIRAEYGLSHGQWGAVYMAGTLASAFTLPHLGRIVDVRSARGVVLLIVPMLALAAVFMAFSAHVALLVLTIYLLRLFGQGMMPHAAYTATARWFAAQRGRALSLVVLGHNAGDALLTNGFVLLVALIGWRAGWVVAACILLAALPLIASLVAVERAPRASDPVPRIVDAPDWTRGQVLRDPIFYMAMAGVMAPSFIVTVILFHQVYLVELRGWSLEVFASAFILWASVNSVFTIVSGQLIDRFSGVRLLPFVLLPLGGGCILLALSSAAWTPFAFMAIVGLSNGLTTTLFGAVWPEFYGLKHLGTIRAMVASATVLATAAGPGITGALIDRGVSYPGQLMTMGLYCIVVSGLLAYVSRQVAIRAAARS